MEDLTPRQIVMLKAIIQEYSETGEAVGSDVLDKKHNLGVSPATIRNDMVQLAKKGYLKKEYFSSGRVPTSKAFRLYISTLMNEKELSTAEEVSYKSDIWDFRHEMHQLLQHAAQSLARRTGLLAVATTNRGDVYYFGVKNLLNNKEFWDIQRAQNVLEKFDQFSYWEHVLKELSAIEDELLFIFKDIDRPEIEDMTSVFGEFSGPHIRGAIGVVGPRRMNYEIIVPNIKYFTSLIESIVESEQ